VVRVRLLRTALHAGRAMELSSAQGAEGLLVVAPHASPAAVDLLTARGAVVVTDDGVLALPTHALTRAPATPTPTTTRGPLPWSLLHVARLTAFAGPIHQRDLARLAGVTQKTVSLALARLRALHLIEVDPGGTSVPDLHALVEWWLGAYPQRRDIVAHYVGTGALPSQLEQAAAAAGPQRLLVSGSLAADALAPWARPIRAKVYITDAVDLTAVGFVPAPAAQATLSVAISPDPGLAVPMAGGRPWATATGTRVEVADPLQVLSDLREEGMDADQQADRLVNWLTSPGRRRLHDHLAEALASRRSPVSAP
jgi:hypothetical protein